MADFGGPDRVKKMRESRREQGDVETNVWIPKAVREAIDSKVASKEYPTRRMAIISALEQVYLSEKSRA